MDEKEVRIGNYVNIKDTIFRIELQDLYYTSGDMNPVPLTEEWLFKFGFDKLREYNDGENIIIEYGKSIIVGDNSHNEKLVIIFPFNHCEIGNYRSEDAYILNTTIDYVHQLQNLYFALTGQEL